jgi:hypothetical protein
MRQAFPPGKAGFAVSSNGGWRMIDPQKQKEGDSAKCGLI